MRYNQILNKTINKYNNFLFNKILNEGIEDIKKYFPKLDEKSLRKLISLDPTYKGGEQLGKYGQWIIRLFYNNIKNIERKKQFNELLQQYPDGINPKTGQKFEQPKMLPAIKSEDLEKIPNSLKQYEIYKNKIKKPIDLFKTLPELDTELEKIKSLGIPTDKKVLDRYNLFEKYADKGLKKIFENADWIIAIPTKLECSVPFGEYTSWCTTSPHGKYYYYYSDKGLLYILLNKKTGEFYQFHFETQSFMDASDSRINMDTFTEKYPDIAKFLFNYQKDSVENKPSPLIQLQETFSDLLKNPNEMNKRLFPSIHNFKIEGDTITGTIDSFDELEDVYDDNRYSISFDWIDKFIQDPYTTIDFHPSYSISEIQNMYIGTDWDNYAKKNNLNISFDDLCTLVSISDELPQNLETFLNEEFSDLGGFVDTVTSLEETGTIDEVFKQIKDSLKSNFPIFKNIEFIDDNIKIYLEMPVQFAFTYLVVDKLGLDILEKGNIPSYKEPIQQEFNFNESKYKFKDEWYMQWVKYDDDDDPWAYNEEYERNWLYVYRYSIDDGNGKFSISEPSYDWYGFDDSDWKIICNNSTEELKQLIGDKTLQDFISQE